MSQSQIHDSVSITWKTRSSYATADQVQKGRLAALAVLAAGGSRERAFNAIIAGMFAGGESFQNEMIVTINGEPFGQPNRPYQAS